jgi:hypothetical protein
MNSTHIIPMKKTYMISKRMTIAALVLFGQLSLSCISEAQMQYDTAITRISPDSCIEMLITIPISGAITATTSIIANSSSNGASFFYFSGVTLDSFGNYSIPNGTSGWILFFDSSEAPVCMAALSGGYITCDCSGGSCHLHYDLTSTGCHCAYCSGTCSGCTLNLHNGDDNYAGPVVVLSGNNVNFNGVLYSSP